jgi:hypothetical protein
MEYSRLGRHRSTGKGTIRSPGSTDNTMVAANSLPPAMPWTKLAATYQAAFDFGVYER